VDSKGNPIICDPTSGCSLHLHGYVSYYFKENLAPPFYSSRNAIGVVVAVGNVGLELSDAHDDLRTYLSRDAGLTWFEIAQESVIYELGDHGGILVWAPYTRSTTQIWYSLDEGLTVKVFTFTNESVDVANILIEEGGDGQKFILYGSQNSKKVIFGLDFTDEQPRICDDDDYEIWSPSDGAHGDQHCFLGTTNLYLRRKRASECYNARNTDHLANKTYCNCTWEDYECRLGFEPSPRDPVTGEFQCEGPGTEPPDYCPLGTTYLAKSGLFYVTGTECVGTNLELVTRPCPGSRTTSGTTGNTGDGGNTTTIAIVVILITVVAIVGGIAFAVWRKPTLLGNLLGKFRKTENYAPVSTVADDEGDS